MALKKGSTPMSQKEGMSHVKSLPRSTPTGAKGVSQGGKTTGATAAAHIPTGVNR